jgi:peptide chain release factor 1
MRSEKIRTYNFPQNRLTDHRINFTTQQLQDVLDGGQHLDTLLELLQKEEEKEQVDDWISTQYSES